MRYFLILAIGAAGCAGGAKSTSGPSLPVPTTKATSEMAEGDPDLRPVAIAAAGYYKRTTSSSRLGFSGVFIDQLEIPRLTDEVARRLNLVTKPRIACVAAS